MKRLSHILEQNKQWAESLAAREPDFFPKLTKIQQPEYLWIGCSDSRVPANQITGLLPGEVFVHRNVGNIVYSTDLNCLSVLQFAVDSLQVKHVIVCGHYGCGAVKAAWEKQRLGLIDHWLSAIRELGDAHREELQKLEDEPARVDRLCELNVLLQARNVCQSKVVTKAWQKGREISIHAWIYRLNDGRLKDLNFCISSPEELKEATSRWCS